MKRIRKIHQKSSMSRLQRVGVSGGELLDLEQALALGLQRGQLLADFAEAGLRRLVHVGDRSAVTDDGLLDRRLLLGRRLPEGRGECLGRGGVDCRVGGRSEDAHVGDASLVGSKERTSSAPAAQPR